MISISFNFILVILLLAVLLFVAYRTTKLASFFNIRWLKLPRLVWSEESVDKKKQPSNEPSGKQTVDEGNDENIDLDAVKDDASLESIEFKSSGILDSQGTFSEGTMNSDAASSMPDDEMSLFKE